MLWKEVDDCDICPLREEGLCKAGEFNPSPDGAYEPICDSFNPDDDVDEIIAGIHENIRRYEDIEDRRIQRERERKAKNDLANKRRREAAWHVRTETREIRILHDRIAKNKAAVHFAQSMADAFNFANEMFRYEERYRPKSELEQRVEAENKEHSERIKELEAIKKQKLTELRKRRKEANDA